MGTNVAVVLFYLRKWHFSLVSKWTFGGLLQIPIVYTQIKDKMADDEVR